MEGWKVGRWKGRDSGTNRPSSKPLLFVSSRVAGKSRVGTDGYYPAGSDKVSPPLLEIR